MQIIDVPVFEDDGSIKFTVSVSPRESQALLGFALNFLTAQGYAVQTDSGEDGDGSPQGLND